jgi:hypothetical protein
MSNLNLSQKAVRTLSVPHPRLPRVQIRRINIGEIVPSATALLLQPSWVRAWQCVFATRLRVSAE